MRFKYRCGVSFREIVNNILKIAACRLSWNEPVSNNDSARHKLPTISFVAAGVSPCKDETPAAIVSKINRDPFAHLSDLALSSRPNKVLLK